MSLASARIRTCILLIAVAASAPACDSSSTEETATDTGADDPGPDSPCDAAPARIFLNRNPATYQPGADDAATNRTTKVDVETSVTPTTYDDAQWNEFANCVRDAVAPFHLEVVETEPADGSYTEIAVGDNHWDQPVIVALASNSCELAERPLMFLFTQNALNSPGLMCRFAVAYWATVAAGLDFTNDGSDWMNIAASMGPEWTDGDTPCTSLTGEPRPCRCEESSETQNSFATMTDRFGPACP